jgi:hypothetical protein
MLSWGKIFAIIARKPAAGRDCAGVLAVWGDPVPPLYPLLTAGLARAAAEANLVACLRPH